MDELNPGSGANSMRSDSPFLGGWVELNASESSKVVFLGVRQLYSSSQDLHIFFRFISGNEYNEGDVINLTRVGEDNLSKPRCSLDPKNAEDDIGKQKKLLIPSGSLPKRTEFYQFLYMRNNVVIGASSPFYLHTSGDDVLAVSSEDDFLVVHQVEMGEEVQEKNPQPKMEDEKKDSQNCAKEISEPQENANDQKPNVLTFTFNQAKVKDRSTCTTPVTSSSSESSSSASSTETDCSTCSASEESMKETNNLSSEGKESAVETKKKLQKYWKRKYYNQATNNNPMMEKCYDKSRKDYAFKTIGNSSKGTNEAASSDKHIKLQQDPGCSNRQEEKRNIVFPEAFELEKRIKCLESLEKWRSRLKTKTPDDDQISNVRNEAGKEQAIGNSNKGTNEASLSFEHVQLQRDPGCSNRQEVCIKERRNTLSARRLELQNLIEFSGWIDKMTTGTKTGDVDYDQIVNVRSDAGQEQAMNALKFILERTTRKYHLESKQLEIQVETNKTLMAELKEQDEKLKSMDIELQKVKKARETSRKDVLTLSCAKNLLEMELREKIEKIKSLEKALQDESKMDKEPEISEQMNKLIAEKESLAATVDVQKSQILKLRQELEEEGKRKVLDDPMRISLDENLKLRQKLEDEMKKKEILEDQVWNLTKENDLYQKTSGVKVSADSEMRDMYLAMVASKTLAVEEISSLQSEQEKLSELLNTMSEEREQLKSEIEHLRKEILTLKNQESPLKEAYETLKAEHLDLEKEYVILIGQGEVLKGTHKALEAKHLNLEKEFLDLKNQEVTLRETCEALEMKLIKSKEEPCATARSEIAEDTSSLSFEEMQQNLAEAAELYRKQFMEILSLRKRVKKLEKQQEICKKKNDGGQESPRQSDSRASNTSSDLLFVPSEGSFCSAARFNPMGSQLRCEAEVQGSGDDQPSVFSDDMEFIKSVHKSDSDTGEFIKAIEPRVNEADRSCSIQIISMDSLTSGILSAGSTSTLQAADAQQRDAFFRKPGLIEIPVLPEPSDNDPVVISAQRSGNVLPIIDLTASPSSPRGFRSENSVQRTIVNCHYCGIDIEVFDEDMMPLVDHLHESHSQYTCPVCGVAYDATLPIDYYKMHVENHFND